MVYQKQITIRTASGKGAQEFTDAVAQGLRESGVQNGTVNSRIRDASF